MRFRVTLRVGNNDGMFGFPVEAPSITEVLDDAFVKHALNSPNYKDKSVHIAIDPEPLEGPFPLERLWQ